MSAAFDLDIGERLYARNTVASSRKRSNNANSAVLEGAYSNFCEQGMDVKSEVDRMFNAVMTAIEDEQQQEKERTIAAPETMHAAQPWNHFVLDENSDSRIAAMKALMRPVPLSMYRKNTFGSGRTGMADAVKKVDGPGPGQYYPDEVSARSGRSGSSNGSRSSLQERSSDRPSTSSSSRRPKGFSFGSGKRETTLDGALAASKSRSQQLSLPGPGEYKLPGAFDGTNVASRKGTFGCAPRNKELSKDSTPGPGSYALDLPPKQPVATADGDKKPNSGFLTSSPRMPSSKTDAPGPGTYHQVERGQSPPPLRDTPMFSFPKSESKGPSSVTPGPGTYDLTTKSTRETSIRGVIPLAGRDDGVWGGKKKFSEPVPGPGAYNPLDEGDQHGELPVTLKFRHSEKPSVVPGPGEYTITAEPSGPKWSMVPRRASPEPDVGPGPSDYVVEGNAQPQGAVFGTAKRDVHEDIAEKLGIPGPGNYQPEEKPTCHNITFGTQKQRPENLQGQASPLTPGPGAYNGEVPSMAPAALLSTTSQRFLSASTAGPGPGYYDSLAAALVEARRAASAFVGSGKRETAEHFVHASSTQAGPGSYELPSVDRGPQYTIGLPHPHPRPDVEGGPGAYAVPLSTIGEGPKATMGSTVRATGPIDPRAAAAVPGPGAYDAQLAGGAPSVVFGTAVKEPKLAEGAPVGPGAYDPQLPIGGVAGGPFGTSIRFDRAKEAAPSPYPGPGAYTSDQQASSPTAVFGTSAGHLTEVPLSSEPGPGSYEAAVPSSTKAPVFGTSLQRVALVSGEATLIPGPGAYEPQQVVSHVPAAMVTGRPYDKQQPDNIGPGSYFPLYVSDPGAPSPVFGTSAARVGMARTEDFPGPGAYAAAEQDTSPSALFLGSSRFLPDAGADLPGPGAYEPSPDAQRAVTIGTAPRRTDVALPTIAPGPGAYNPEIPSDVVAFSINTTSKQLGERPTDAPGPGAYSPQLVGPSVHSVSFGGSAARPQEKFPLIPGPGAYSPADLYQSPAIAFPQAARIPPNPNDDLPGPGHYQLLLSDNAPQAHFLTAPRVTDMSVRRDVPGPGQYNPNDPSSENHNGYSFSQAAAHPPPRSDVPGPCYYVVPQPASNGPAYSFGTGTQHVLPTLESAAPGPGAYDANLVQASGPAYSFGKLTREQIEAQERREVPGPGAYELASRDNGPSYSVGTAPRRTVEANSEAPGPGSYAVVYVNDAAVPAYTVSKGPRFPGDGPEVPGPGAYNAVLLSDGTLRLGSMIGTAPRQIGPNDKQDVPGPGQYNPLNPNQEATPAYSFGSGPVRFPPLVSTDAPGPLSYQPHNPNLDPHQAPGMPTAVRFPEESNHDKPGPGQYDPRPSGPEAPAVSFTTAPRPFEAELARRANEPGPGHYDPSVYAPEGPAFTFGSKPLDPLSHAGDFPGPGQYSTARPFGEEARAVSMGPLPMVDQEAAFARRVNATPGPNVYYLPTTLDNHAVPFGSAPRTNAEVDAFAYVPGPGAYQSEGQGMFDGPKYSFPRDSRRGDDVGEAMLIPGPGSYNAGRAFDRTKVGAPVYSFAMADRDAGGEDARKHSLVGPGAYDVGAPPHAGPSYSFPQASDFTNGGVGQAAQVPGPGLYYVPPQWGLGGHTMGGKWTAANPSSNVPGPGQYRLHDYDPYARDHAIGIDFSKGGERPCNIEVRTVHSDMPGPGQYFKGAIQFGDGRGVTILNRPIEPFIERTPGPPTYYHPTERHPFYDPLSH